jgi:tetratricopeptide (TPR) repeat protein
MRMPARAFQGILMGFPWRSGRSSNEPGCICASVNARSTGGPSRPRRLKKRLTAATAALNNGNDADAAELARSVLGDDPKHDLALYLLAAIQARKGDHDEALSLLAKVLAITPEASAQARADADFAGLHELEAFWTLT